MFAEKPLQRTMGCVPCGLYKKKVVNDRGLGDLGDKSSDLEQGYSAPKGIVGKTILPIVTQVGTMIGQATGTGLIVGLAPKKIVKEAAIDINPLSVSLAPFTFGASLLPGVSQVLGKVFKTFSGMFVKATHYGDCMKWWNNDNNIRGMVGVYSIDSDSIAREYVSKYAAAANEYKLQHAKEIDILSPIMSIISISSALSKRISKVSSIFINLIRGSGILEISCAVHAQGYGESMGVSYTSSEVQGFIGQIKEEAKQKEQTETINEIRQAVDQQLVSMLKDYIYVVSQKAAVVQETRKTASVFQLPTGVTSISKGGALVLMPGVSSNLVLTNMTVGPSVIRKK